MKVAVIDVGTNTINLLIAEKKVKEGGFNILFIDKIAARLGAGGIHKKTLTPEAFERGIKALEAHKQTIESWSVERTFTFATASLRIPENGAVFVKAAKDLLAIDIQIISGDREAELIFEGVSQIVPFTKENALIMDIGGGSVEFIWCNQAGVKWMHSFNLGVSLILELFKPNDPLSNEDILSITNYLDKELQLLWDQIKEPTKFLIGASGSFNTLANMLRHDPEINMPVGCSPLNIADTKSILEGFMFQNYEQRAKLPGMDLARVEFMPIASMLIRLVMDKLGINKLTQSPYALKEGAMYELFKD